MANFSIPRVEACAIDFTALSSRYGYRNYINPESLDIDLPVKAVKWVYLKPFGYFREDNEHYQLCPIIDIEKVNLENLRAILPFGAHVEDDGTFWWQVHSSVERHFSLDHESTFYRDNGFSSEFDNNDRLDRKEACKESGKPNKFDLAGRHRYGFKAQVILRLSEDQETLIYQGAYTNGSSMCQIEVKMAGLANVSYVGNLVSDEPQRLSDLFVTMAIKKRGAHHMLDRGNSRLFLDHGKKFAAKLQLNETYDRKKKPSRRVSFLMDDDRSYFPEEQFVNTRCNTLQGTSFLRFGVRLAGNQVHLTKTKEIHDFNTPFSQVLIHKTAEAWRFVFMFGAFLQDPGFQYENFETLPVFYMIPQYVHRNEVNFKHHTFRGLPLDIQEQIWKTDGLSMALVHAFNGMVYQLSQMRRDIHAYTVHHLAELPPGHRIAGIGLGLAANTKDDGPITEGGHAYDRSLWPLGIRTSRATFRSRAVDILDDLFFHMPPNQLRPGYKVQKVATVRNVRL